MQCNYALTNLTIANYVILYIYLLIKHKLCEFVVLFYSISILANFQQNTSFDLETFIPLIMHSKGNTCNRQS